MVERFSFADTMNIGGSRLLRWGRDVEPEWEYGTASVSVAADTELVSYDIPTGKDVYIYGVYLAAQEENTFSIKWMNDGTLYTKKIYFPSKGSVYFIDGIAMNEGYPAKYRQGDAIDSVTVSNDTAGSPLAWYQAGIFHGDLVV